MRRKHVALFLTVAMLVLIFYNGYSIKQQMSKLSVTGVKDSQSVVHGDPRFIHRSGRSVLNSSEIKEAIGNHNRLRRLERAANMEIMIWDNDLAIKAEVSAERCIWNHTNTGQNLYATNSPLPISLYRAIQAWYNEKPYYMNYFNTGICQAPGQQCLHYSQVVWATSRKLGCAYTRCAKLQLTNFTNALFLVCNYDPPGNVIGEKPYQIGRACAKCATGSGWCNYGLCDQSCTAVGPSCACTPLCINFGSVNNVTCSCSCAPGWYGSICNDVCENKDPLCDPQPGQMGYPPYYCSDSKYGPPTQKLCPKMCNICQAIGKSSNFSISTRKTLLLTMLAVFLSRCGLEHM